MQKKTCTVSLNNLNPHTLKYLLLTLLCAACFSSFAQKNINLTVTLQAAKKDTIGNATLQLFSLPDSQLVNTQAYKITGNVFSVVKFSKYFIRVTSAGIETTEKVVAVADKPVELSIPVKRKVANLQNVTVVSKKPLIKQEDDKTIVDAEPLASSSTNAYEVLEKVPGAIVDQDGNVYLSSTTPATIQINGREVKLSTADIASLLKSLPPGSVSKVEILRNPSAKYDAASSGGIINIVLKKGVKLGTSGTMNVGYFQGVYSTKFAGFNLNKGNGKINSYLSYQFTDRNNFEELNSERKIAIDNSTLAQKSYTTYPAQNNYAGAGIDVQFTKKFSLGYDLRLSSNANSSNASNLINITDNNTLLNKGSNESIISNNGNNTYLSNNFSADYKLDSLGSEWETEIDYTYYKNTNTQLYNNYYYLPARPSILGDGKSNNRKNIFTAKTDLVIKFKKKFTLEAGFKTISSASRNAADYFYQSGTAGRKVDSFQTNAFRYKEVISSGYLQLAKTIAGVVIKPGIRMEATDIAGNQLFPKDTSLSIKRTDFFPYLFIGHPLFKLFGFQLKGTGIYRRSISRPYYESLNPYPKYVDQYLYDVGNPRLQPQFATNYEYNIMADDFPIFAIGVNKTKNIFSNVTYQDDVTKIAYRTFDNLGKSKELYLRIVGGLPPGGKYFFYMGAQHNFVTYDGFYQNLPLQYSRGSWTFFTYQQIKATPTLTVSMHGFMRTKGLQNFYELKNFGGVTFSANKSVLDKKANIILTINDAFRTNRVNFALNQGNVSATGLRFNDTRRLGITFRYNFGIKPKEEKKNVFDQPAEN